MNAETIYDPLKDLPGQYWRDGNLTHFMEKCSGWILNFCRRNLNPDPDKIGDFYVHFYEKVPVCLDKYKSRQHLPFTGYLATYLRHEFYNFARTGRTRRICEFPVSDVPEPKVHTEEFRSDFVKSRLSMGVENLPGDLRLPLKLHFGLDLNTLDLRIFAGKFRGPEEASRLLLEFHSRKDKIRERMSRLQDRASRLNYLIHSPGPYPAVVDRTRVWRKWKHRIQTLLDRDQSVFSLSELAQMYGVNKSSIARRIEKAQSLLQEVSHGTG